MPWAFLPLRPPFGKISRENREFCKLRLPRTCSKPLQKGESMKSRTGLLAASAMLVTPVAMPAQAQQLAAADTTEQVIVLGTLPGSDIGLAADKVPGTLQSFDASQITAQHGGSLLSSLQAQTAGVSLSDVQGNGLFQNLRFHGFDASPLQGTPQHHQGPRR